MPITRTIGAFIGTDEGAGITVADGTTTVGAQVDVLGDDQSTGELMLYLVFSSTVTAGSIDVKVNPVRVSGQVYSRDAFPFQPAPINGRKKAPLGRMTATRFMNAEVRNNGTGAAATNVAVLYELIKYA